MAEAEPVVEQEFYIGDTETCGLPPHHYPCQIGLQKIDPVTFDVLWEIESLIDPQYPIGEIASGIHGITDDMVADAPTLQEFVDVTLEGGLKGDITMIAFNMQFDVKALSQLGNVSRTVCALFESRQSLAHLPLPNMKLQTLLAHFGIDPGRAHSALADTNATRLLLKKICEVTGRTLEHLAESKTRVVHTMPWGEHRGSLLITIPKPYLTWLNNRPDLEPNLRKSVEKALGMKR